MGGITASTLPWYISRATGVVSLVLLTAVMVIGILINRQGRLPGLPRFAVTNLHRNLSLMTVVFIVIHVVTAVIDGYVSIPLISGVIPFTSGYEGFWLGLGAISFDLMLALIVTSLIRGRLSHRVWKAVHWLAYASWPVAFAHSIGSSSDLQGGLLLGLAVLCAAALAAALVWRLVMAAREVPRSERVSAVLAAAASHRHRGDPPDRAEAGRRLVKADRR
jgi:predicted ferric reductase